VPVIQFLQVYTTRAERLAQYSSEHARRLREDSLSFVRELESLDGDFVNSWYVAINESTRYILFVAIRSKKIVGCLRVVDRPKVSDQEWQNIWGDPVAINFAN
jgi:hypothetical protein